MVIIQAHHPPSTADLHVLSPLKQLQRVAEAEAAHRGCRWDLIGWDVARGCPATVLGLKRRGGDALRGDQGGEGGDADGDCSDASDSSDGSDSGGSSEEEDGSAARVQPRATRVASAGVVELESGKLEAIRAAVELACALMAVDDVLMDSR